MNVNPYLFFDGRCEEALEFYKSAIGAKVGMMMRFKESPDPHHAAPGSENKVMHACFNVGDSPIMASDGMNKGKPNFDGFAISINAKDEARPRSCSMRCCRAARRRRRWRKPSLPSGSAC